MEKRQEKKALNTLIALLDLLLTILAFLVGYMIRDNAIVGKPFLGLSEYAWILWVFLPTLYLSLRYFGFYGAKKTDNVPAIVVGLIKAFIICTLVSAAAVFITKSDLFSRLYFFIFVSVDFFLMLAEKLLVKFVLLRMIQVNAVQTRALVVGDVKKAEEVLQKIREEEDIFIHIVGFVSLDGTGGLGSIEQLTDLVIQHTVDEVIFVLPKDFMGEVEPYLQGCEELGVTVRMLLDLYDLKLSKTYLSYVGSVPMLTFHTVTLNEGQMLVKRMMDIAGALVGLVITGIVTLVLAPVIKLDSPGPVFFRQQRVGQNGRIFWCYKFRSMYRDAEERMEELKGKNEMSGAVFKMKDDPRITRVGKFLRRTSLDELPQFYNVLKGDMSLVGTRPPTVDEVLSYEAYHRRRLSIKPGITGLWQVSGRNDIKDFEEIYQLDIKYIDTWSIALDIKIIAKTFAVVVSRNGAQ